VGVSFFTSGGVESNLKPDVQLKLNEFTAICLGLWPEYLYPGIIFTTKGC
jgi:hypothetical protein